MSDDEKERAARFRFERDREFFVAGRGILRELLGGYLKRPPPELQFQYGSEGKPCLSLEDWEWPIRFNVSHSRGIALYAFSGGLEVGVDVEEIRSDFASEEIAERFFSAGELEELRGLPAELKADGFFNCWTRKEAYVKAWGSGLGIPLDSFGVTLIPGVPARFVRGVDPCWNLIAFSPGPNYAAALAFDGAPCKVQFFEF